MKKFFMKFLVLIAALACLGAVQASVLTLSDWGTNSLVDGMETTQHLAVSLPLAAPVVDSTKEVLSAPSEHSEPSRTRVFLFGALMMVFIAGTRLQRD
jgi:hypothetical protein